MAMAIAGSADQKNGVVAAALVSVVPWVLMLSSVAYVEAALMLYTALAVAWMIRSDDGKK